MSPAPQKKLETELAEAKEKAERYERGLRAIAASTLVGIDFADWVQQVTEEMLDGLEAECPICGTHVHKGSCVDEEMAELG